MSVFSMGDVAIATRVTKAVFAGGSATAAGMAASSHGAGPAVASGLAAGVGASILHDLVVGAITGTAFSATHAGVGVGSGIRFGMEAAKDGVTVSSVARRALVEAAA